jgi:hypothetical protein
VHAIQEALLIVSMLIMRPTCPEEVLDYIDAEYFVLLEVTAPTSCPRVMFQVGTAATGATGATRAIQ